MSAAVVWTYWLAFPLLGAGILAALVTAWMYYRRVLIPKYQWTQYQWLKDQRLRYQRSQPSTGAVRPGGIQAQAA